MAPLTATPTTTYDVSDVGTRGLNAALQSTAAPATVTVVEPAGAHALAVRPGRPDRRTHRRARRLLRGRHEPACDRDDRRQCRCRRGREHDVGHRRVTGDASQSAGATAHGGLLVIEGNAAARCGISMKGVDIVVGGSIGHMSAFMGQADGSSCSVTPVRRWVIRVRDPYLRARNRCLPRGRLHREGDARRHRAELGNCSTPRVSTPTQPSSPVTARPASSTPSTSTTPRPTDARHFQEAP